MDLKSEAYLTHVHPDLAKVMRAASQGTPFHVCYGIRSLAEEAKAVVSGHSQTMHSRHLANSHGVACAVDVVWIDEAGKLDWAAGHEGKIFGAIATNVLLAARELGIHVEWGGTWNETTVIEPGHFHDWGHFQLPWKLYP
jgi:peptidoglycan L-alanyl-D-glutamate endopeptidase CwlK